MKRRGERGFSTLELVVGLGISAVIGVAALGGTGQLWSGSGAGGEYIRAVSQVQSAERWLTRDSRVAEAVVTDNLSAGEFLVLNWTEYDYGESADTYHSVTYYFSGLSQNVGDLKRVHWNSASGDTETLVAREIYYNTSDPGGTSLAALQGSVLYIRLVGRSGDSSETREFHLSGRPELWQW